MGFALVVVGEFGKACFRVGLRTGDGGLECSESREPEATERTQRKPAIPRAGTLEGGALSGAASMSSSCSAWSWARWL